MRLKALLLAAALASPLPALAEPLIYSQPDTRSPARTVVNLPLPEVQGAETWGEKLGRAVYGALDFLGLGDWALDLLVASPAEMARRNARVTDDFAWLMDVAGYKLKEVESSVGLIPDIVLTFGQARQLTEGDRNYLERQLDRHALRHGDLLSMTQRAIVRAVVDASELGNFEVDKVEVDLLPLPKVKLVLAPSAAPLGLEAARLMRAIDRLTARVQDLSARFPAPEQAAVPAVATSGGGGAVSTAAGANAAPAARPAAVPARPAR